MFKLLRFSLIASLLVIGSHNLSADVASLESNYVAGQTDIVSKLNNDRTTLTNSVNNIRGVFAGSVQSSGQIQADTIGEENMADDANPRIRTSEGASCADLVVSGLLPGTSTNLISTVSAGVAYPDGYRIDKTTGTAKTFTASVWTYGYINTSGSFEYQETAIDAATPAAPANTATLFRVSTDGSSIVSISDLRSTSCTAGPFEAISDANGEATLEDVLVNGQPVRQYSNAGRTPQGWVQGLFVSRDTASTFVVTQGSVYINGEYRFVSSDFTVTTGNDAPATGGSGLDTGAIAASTRYYVYAVADQDAVPGFSISYSTSASAPSGVTNYRLIGSLTTDASSNFTSSETVTAHGINPKEIIAAYVEFEGNASNGANINIDDAFNISSVADSGTGNYTITIDQDMNSAQYAAVCSANQPGDTTQGAQCGFVSKAAGSIVMRTAGSTGSSGDCSDCSAVFIGDTRR